jgi:hypothetical protein
MHYPKTDLILATRAPAVFALYDFLEGAFSGEAPEAKWRSHEAQA